MEKSYIMVLVLFSFLLYHEELIVDAAETIDGSETWSYAEVRPKAFMFWWYYKSPQRKHNKSKPWPVILWLQGGPGSSGVGIGNFEEIGPLDRYLESRNSTWLQKADLLFVVKIKDVDDAPVGTGYSYVEDANLLSKTDEEVATDITTLLISIFNQTESLRSSPLYVVAESYGGKYAVLLGLSILQAITEHRLKANFGGIALGNSWISPEDYVFSWGPLLKDMSRLDINGLRESNRLANQIKKLLEDGNFVNATRSFGELESVIYYGSNGVDFYNFLLDFNEDPLSSSATALTKKYSKYLTSSRSSMKVGRQDGNLTRLMNSEIKTKLKIIPKDLTWKPQSVPVFRALRGDFMKPRIEEVDQLLSKGVNITVYNGQLDLICSTKGTEAWIEKLKWNGIKTYLNNNRTPMYCGKDKRTKAFVKSFQNFKFFFILGTGHFVPVQQPCAALKMIADITSSSAAC